jgi:hypothetical protein
LCLHKILQRLSAEFISSCSAHLVAGLFALQDAFCSPRFAADPKNFQKSRAVKACMPARGFLVEFSTFFQELDRQNISS